MKKNRDKYILPTLISYITCISSFDLWMSYIGYDTFAMIVSLVNSSWELSHVIVRVLEVQNMIGATMENLVKILLYSFGLLDKIIAYVKNKGSNLNTLTNVLKYVVFCFAL